MLWVDWCDFLMKMLKFQADASPFMWDLLIIPFTVQKYHNQIFVNDWRGSVIMMRHAGSRLMSFFIQNVTVVLENRSDTDKFWCYSSSNLLTVQKYIMLMKENHRPGRQLSYQRVTSRFISIHRWWTAQSTHPDVRVKKISISHVFQQYQHEFLDRTKEYHEIQLVKSRIEEKRAIFYWKFTSIYSPHQLCSSSDLEIIWITF